MNEIAFRDANDQAVTSSLLVAEKFGKEHKHVLDSIRKLIEGVPKFRLTLCLKKQLM